MKSLITTIALAVTCLGIANVSTQGRTAGESATVPSPQTQAVIFQTEKLSDKTRAQLKEQLAGIVKKILAAAASKDGASIKNLISDQYRDIWEKTLKYANSKHPKAHYTINLIARDFADYKLLSIDKVIIAKDVAFVQAKITYRSQPLAEIVQEEKGVTAKSDQDEFTNFWNNFGGVACATIQQKGGAGIATYYFVLQKGVWRLHLTYLSERPFPPAYLKEVVDEMETLVE